MKIGIDISASIYGTGVSEYLINLVANLPKEAMLPFGYSLRRQSELKTLFPKARIWPVPPTLVDWLWNRLHIYSIENLLGPVDVVHSSDWVQPPSKAKKVTTVHDLSPFLYPAEMDTQIVAVHTRRMKWVVAECDAIICVSQNTANDLQRLFGVSPQKVKVIYEAMPADHILTPQVTKYSNYLVAIGARQPRKNIDRLISSYLRYKDKYNLPEKLIIVGEMTTRVSDPSVIYTGYVTNQDLVNYLAGAAAFVYPSLYEGFGLPILEAFHYQVPVAASNTSALPEVGGEAIVYFDPLDEEAIARAVANAIVNKDILVAAGIKQLAKFSWSKAAAETLEVYKSIC